MYVCMYLMYVLQIYRLHKKVEALIDGIQMPGKKNSNKATVYIITYDGGAPLIATQ